MSTTVWLIFGGLCAICWAIAGLLALRTMRLSARTEGKVLRVAVASDEDSTTYHPVVEYTVDGKRYEFQSRGTGRRNYSEGDTVPVRHHPEQPDKARIDRPIYAYQGAISWVIIGIVVLLIPVFAQGGSSGDAD